MWRKRVKTGRFVLFVSALLFGSLVQAESFELISQTVAPNSQLTEDHVYNGFGCTGKNVSPQLQWTSGPEGTKSYAVTVYDPDAPTGSGWWHWIVYNIPADVTELPAGAGDASGNLLPDGALHGRTDFGTFAFGGSCPPSGDKDHRYIFTVFALKTEKIDVPTDATAALICFIINAKKIGESGFTAKYGR
jgi:Raf kinase inhibitor-like YbhB/YbcL family protein